MKNDGDRSTTAQERKQDHAFLSKKLHEGYSTSIYSISRKKQYNMKQTMLISTVR